MDLAAGQETCGSPPRAPDGLTVTVMRTTVTARWQASGDGCSAASYVIEAGSAPGVTDLPSVPSHGTATTLTLRDVTEGLYYARVRAINADGSSEPSNEVRVLVGSSPCGGLPPVPRGVFATVVGTTISTVWNPVGRAPNAYLVEIGSSPGASDVVSEWTTTADPTLTAIAEPGTYFLRVRGRNDCGIGGWSNSILVPSGTTPGVPDVVVVRRTAERGVYFPTVERLQNGHLLVVYYDSPGHVSPMGRISLVRSIDGGRTWSSPVVAVDSPLDDRDPSLVQTARGTLLLSYFSPPSAGRSDVAGVFVTRSDDEGATWSAPARVDTALVTSATSAKIVELDTGDLLIPIYGATTSRARSAVVRSTDGGRAWSKAQEVQIRSSSPRDLVEPALVSFGGGRLMVIMRAERPNDEAMQSRSTDGGRTWSEPVPTGHIAQGSDLLTVQPDPAGSMTAVHSWGDWSRRFGDGRTTLMQLIELSAPTLDAVYGNPRVIYNSHCDDTSQPSSVALGTRIFTVYYDGCSGYIGGTFSTIAWPRR